jgi:multisubunit Na+/H+ antiporter MnhE subunit
MAAFGVSMTAVNTYLVPLCCILLTYSVWCLYKGKRSFTYKPFLMGLTGAILIVLDNFILGERFNLMNIPSWVGNALLIIGTIWAGRDTTKENSNPFGV